MSKTRERYEPADQAEYPLTISSFRAVDGPSAGLHEIGSWVSVRPCAKQYENKTYLGVYLGDLPIDMIGVLDNETKALIVSFHRNPAIYVPDIKRIIYGCESWWGVIKSPDDLRKITDADIENVWYVRALKELIERETASNIEEGHQ